MLRKDSADSAAKGARITWIVGTILIPIFLFTDDNSLTDSIKRGEMSFAVLFALSVFMSIVFYFLASTVPPGKVTAKILRELEEKEKEDEECRLIGGEEGGGDIEMALAEIKEPIAEIELQVNEERVENEGESLLDRKEGEEEIEERRENDDHQEEQHQQSSSQQQRNDTETKKESETKFFCSKCKIYPPLRSKHCRDCDACILKFDHHCFWIGQCVGEFNHRVFWWFLLFEFIATILGFYICTTGFRTEDSISFLLNVATVLTTLIFAGMTGGLLFFHTYLAMTQQTTWETMRHDSINYLRHVPTEIFPFHEGPYKNLKASEKRGPTLWKWPTPPFVESQHCWFIENEYYSCC